MSELPFAGQVVWLRHPSGTAYDAEVLAVRGDAVVLARPTEYAAFDEPQALEVLWTEADSMLALHVRIVTDGVEWIAEPVEEAGPAQRRSHPRVAVDLPMILVCDHVASEGRLVDMSEAALRVRLAPNTAVPADGASVHVDITLDDEAFVLGGHVLRTEHGQEAAEVVVVFQGVAGATVSRIRRGLFFEQLRLDVLH